MPNTTVRDPSGARPAFGVAKFVDGDTDPTKAGFNVNSSAAVELWDAAGVVRQSIGATTMDIKDSAGVARFAYTATTTSVNDSAGVTRLNTTTTSTQVNDSGGNTAIEWPNAAAMSRRILRLTKAVSEANGSSTLFFSFQVANVTCAAMANVRLMVVKGSSTAAWSRPNTLMIARTAGATAPSPGISAAGIGSAVNLGVNNGDTAGSSTAAWSVALNGANTTTNVNLLDVTLALTTPGTSGAGTLFVEVELIGTGLSAFTGLV